MAIKIKSGRQEPLTGILEINFADLAGLSGANDAFEVPANAIVTGGELVVVTAWTTTSTATLALGDTGSATRYLAATSLKSAARTALTLTGYKHTVAEMLKATIALADEDAAAGDARLRVEYVVLGRSCVNQGLDYRGEGIRGA